MKDLLLHICCGPCALYPVSRLKAMNIEPVGLFYNPNIHPFLEYERRVEATDEISQALGFKVAYHSAGYGLRAWLKTVWSRHPERPARCKACYAMRLEETARYAKEMGFSRFSTTLLYSIYQDHDAIKAIGFHLQSRLGIEFFYMDFRVGWKEGKEKAREIGIYMQPYCGCIVSEEERYEKRANRLRDRLRRSGGVAQ